MTINIPISEMRKQYQEAMNRQKRNQFLILLSLAILTILTIGTIL